MEISFEIESEKIFHVSEKSIKQLHEQFSQTYTSVLDQVLLSVKYRFNVFFKINKTEEIEKSFLNKL
jgi:hypothetical protein